MKGLELQRWFRTRMAPAVLATTLVTAVATPLAFALHGARALAREARAEAARAGEVLRVELEERPRLWRYQSAKLSERLAGAGLAGARLVLFDARGQPVKVDAAPLPSARWTLWGRAEVRQGDALLATAWVAADGEPLAATTFELAGLFGALALVLGALLYGVPYRALDAAERRVQLLLGRLALTLQEEDRRGIARDLHDGVGQAITAARLELKALERRAGLAGDDVGRITARLDEALDEVRRSTGRLAPPALAELGLQRALERHCAAVADAGGLAVSLAFDPAVPPLAAEVETACFRIVQEALANAGRHARARAVTVSLRPAGDEGVALVVEDDGVGRAPEAAAAGPGAGLSGIAERARLLGGRAHFGPGAGGGFRVEVTL